MCFIMKRTIVLLIILVFSSSIIQAQTRKSKKTQKKSSNNGWVTHKKTDEYTTETSYIMYYYKDGKVYAVYFPEDEELKVIKYFDGLKYFDQTWDALMDNNGYFPSRESEVSARLIRTKSDYDEDVYSETISYTDVDRVGQTFFSYFFFHIEPEKLKKAQSISFRWFDYLAYETFTLNISLSGFTACYNSSTK